MTLPALGGGKAYHMIFWWCYIFGTRNARQNRFWGGTDAQLHTSHAATCRNAYEQFDSCIKVSDVKMTSPALGGGNTYHITYSCATKLDIGELKVVGRIRKKIGTYNFNTIDTI